MKEQVRSLAGSLSFGRRYCMQSKAGCYLFIFLLNRGNGMNEVVQASMLQQLQDGFCCADHLYLMCCG